MKSPTASARPRLQPALVLGLLALLVLLAVGARLVHGSTDVPLGEVIRVLGGEGSAMDRLVIGQLRLPAALTACVTGAALGVAGLLMQTLFGNPLADPYVLGVSSGASLGVATLILLPGTTLPLIGHSAGFAGSWGTTVAAVGGATVVMLLVLAVASRVPNTATMLLLGVMFAAMTSALVMVMLASARPEMVAEYISWQFGSYHGITRAALARYLPLLGAILLASLLLARSLNLLQTGENHAASMGLDVRRTRLLVIAATAILAGVSTAWCGPIQFIGIAVPHIARQVMRTADHRVLLPATALIGAGLATIVDVAATLPSGEILPLNAANAAVGAPIVIWVLLRRSREGAW